MTVLEVKSDHAIATWDPPRSHLHNGIIREYFIEVTGDRGAGSVMHRTGTTFMLIPNLHPDTTYTIRVAGHTVRVGPYSNPVQLHTLEDGIMH